VIARGLLHVELSVVQEQVLDGPRGSGPGFVLIYDADGLQIATADPVTRDLAGKLLGRMRLRWGHTSGSGRVGKGTFRETPSAGPGTLQRARAGELVPWYSPDRRVDRAPRAGGHEKRVPQPDR
jgi:hypothetical protein